MIRQIESCIFRQTKIYPFLFLRILGAVALKLISKSILIFSSSTLPSKETVIQFALLMWYAEKILFRQVMNLKGLDHI